MTARVSGLGRVLIENLRIPKSNQLNKSLKNLKVKPLPQNIVLYFRFFKFNNIKEDRRENGKS